MSNTAARIMGSVESDTSQTYRRLAWKRSPSPLALARSTASSRLSFDKIESAQILFQVYLKMFQHENTGLVFSKINLQALKNNSCPHYHRGSLAALLALVKRRVSVEWDKMIDKFLDFVENDPSLLMGKNYIQELYLHLHIFEVFSVSTFKPSFTLGGNSPRRKDMSAWQDTLSVVYITLKVSRARLGAVTEIPYGEFGTPLVQCVLQSSRGSAGRPW